MSFSSGADERRLAIGSVAQQATQLLVALASLAVITVLARELSFAGFGVYTLFVSFSTYLLFAQTAVEGAAVAMLAGAGEDDAVRTRVFSTTVAAYALAGLAARLRCGRLSWRRARCSPLICWTRRRTGLPGPAWRFAGGRAEAPSRRPQTRAGLTGEHSRARL